MSVSDLVQLLNEGASGALTRRLSLLRGEYACLYLLEAILQSGCKVAEARDLLLMSLEGADGKVGDGA